MTYQGDPDDSAPSGWAGRFAGNALNYLDNRAAGQGVGKSLLGALGGGSLGGAGAGAGAAKVGAGTGLGNIMGLVGKLKW